MIKFSGTVLLAEALNEVMDKLITVEYIKDLDLLDTETLKMSWASQNFTANELKLQLNFTEPLMVSTGTEYDRLNFTFVNQKVFLLEGHHQVHLVVN